jgi:GPH family glycoside/pentoside/hexuronide:cation symporter
VTLAAFSWRDGLAYGLLGLPLAFVALPLYVVLPNHYAREFGVPLATLGAVLLGARLFDAFTDPLIGRATDRLFARSITRRAGFGAVAALVLAAGLRCCFSRPRAHPVRWCLGHGDAGADLRGLQRAERGPPVVGRHAGRRRGAAQPHRVLARRPGPGGGAGGVRAACGGGPGGDCRGVCRAAGYRLAGLVARTRAPAVAPCRPTPANIWLPFARPGLSPPAGVFMLNGIASAGAGHAGAVFHPGPAAGARHLEPCSWPPISCARRCPSRCGCAPWQRFGLARTWLAGMLLAVAVFVWARSWARATCWPSCVVCALSAWRWAPTWPCPAPAGRRDCQRGRPRAGTKAPTLAGGTLPPSSTWRWPPGWRCRCWACWAMRPARAAKGCRPWPGLLPAALPAQAGRRCTGPVTSASSDPRTTPGVCNMKRRLPCWPLAVQPPCGPGGLRQPHGQRLRQRKAGAGPAPLLQRHAGRHGIFTDRSGKVVRRFTVVMDCRWQGDEGVLDEDFTYSDGTRSAASGASSTGDGRYTGRADDVVGEATRPGARQRLQLELHAGAARGRARSYECPV